MPSTAETLAAHAMDRAWQRIYGAGRPTSPWPAAVAPAVERGRAADDAAAAWDRWHDAGLDSRFPAAELTWYALLERARVETLASADLPGLRLNLAIPAALLPSSSAGQALYRAARDVFGGDAPPVAAGRLLPPAPPLPPRRLPRWFLQRRAPADRPEVPSEAEVLRVLGAARATLRDASAFAGTVESLVRALAASLEPAPGLAAVPGDGPPTGLVADTPSADDQQVPAPGGDGSPSSRGARPDGSREPGYAVYSTHWDEVVDAKSLLGDGAPAAPALTDEQRRQVAHLAQRLQRRLLAARQPRWSFDEEAGLLDNRRLARLLAPGAGNAVFRQEQASLAPDACVMLLVDQSGSMRGERQRMAALAVAFAVQTLETCRIRCEVLGYTTRFGPENPVVEAWRRAGSPVRPGRLNAVRHIVYKTAAQPLRQVRPSLSLLQLEGWGRENVDGEALAWAARRLAARPEPRKVLLVLCDGAPHEAATTRAMGREFLEDHLRAVIRRLEAGSIHLAALGAGSDVGRFYRNGLALRDPDSVARTLFDHLGDVLTGLPAPAKRFR